MLLSIVKTSLLKVPSAQRRFGTNARIILKALGAGTRPRATNVNKRRQQHQPYRLQFIAPYFTTAPGPRTSVDMAFKVLDTPRTDYGDQSRFGDLDLTTATSIPSPSKDKNDLLSQIRGMRGPSITTPRNRPAFGDRRTKSSKHEFTPLLKSAARNNLARTRSYDKENRLRTPAGLRAGYGDNSPGLALNSSIMMEENTGSSIGGDASGTPVLPRTSSSAVSTPMAILPGRGEGSLDNGRNLATLREQEAVSYTRNPITSSNTDLR